MKRVLLFLVLFGAGLGVLLWLRATSPSHKKEPDVVIPPVAQGQFSEIPVKDGQEAGKQDVISIKLEGSVDFTQRTSTGGDVRKPELIVHANDVDQLEGDVLDMHELSITILDPSTEAKRAQLRSPLSRMKIAREGGALKLPEAEPVRLTDVVLTIHEGGSIAPLELQVPELDWQLGQNRFTSREAVKIAGKGLTASGRGLVVGATTSSFELEKEATIRLDLERRQGVLQTVTLASGKEGGIKTREVAKDGVDLVDVVAGGLADLKIEGSEPLTIAAETIHMVGRKTASPDQPFELVNADAHGRVVAVSRGHTFRAEHAEFRFGPGGRLESATLDGSVVLASGTDTLRSQHAEFRFGASGLLEQAALDGTVTLVSGGDTFGAERATLAFDSQGRLARSTLTGSPWGDAEVGRFLAVDRPELAGTRARLSGAGPLVVTNERGHVIDLAGPARIEVPDAGFVLSASQHIDGYDDPKARAGRLAARGAVALDYGAHRLRADAVEMSWTSVAGVPTATVRTDGVTTLDATAPDGRRALMTARGGLEARATKTNVIVSEARDVDVESVVPAGSSAHAIVVRDLDVEKRTFSAEGNVTFVDPRGSGSADRVEVLEGDEVRLYGAAGRPALFDLARSGSGRLPALSGRIEAGEIVARPDRVTARGRVDARIESTDGRLHFTSSELDLAADPEDPARPAAPRGWRAVVVGDVIADVVRGDERALITCGRLVADGTFTAADPPTVTTKSIHASDTVHVEYGGRGRLVGDGGEFVLAENGIARLSAAEGGRVRAQGRVAGTELPFRIEAAWIELGPDFFAAQDARATLEEAVQARESALTPALADPLGIQGPGTDPAMLREIRAAMIRAARDEISLVGDAYVDGTTLEGEPWRIEAQSIRMRGNFRDARKLETRQIASIDADGGFHAVMGSRLEATGRTLHAVPDRIRVEGEPALMTMLDAEWQSTWIQYDTGNMLLATDTGSLRSRVGSSGGSWSIDYESMQPFDQEQKTILVLRNPRFRFGSDQVAAEWTLFWVDREEWRKSGMRTLDEAMRGRDLRVSTPEETRVAAPLDDESNPLLKLAARLAKARESPIFRVLSELYIEGNIEAFTQGERMARASAFYLDVVDSQGWVQDADVSVDVDIRGQRSRLRAKAGWMRIAPTPDGPSLRAEKAEITSCDFDHPHYVIETGDLRITPKKNESDQRVAYGFSTRKNRLRFANGLMIPLPSFAPEFDREGKPLIDRLVLGNSAKYGAAIRATVNQELGPVGKAAGRAIGKVLQIPDVELNGNWHYNLGILGSRGVLAGIGIDFEARDKFWLNTDFDGIPDQRSDKGLVRVDEDDRSLIRTWFRARSRYTIRDGEWVDLAYSRQSDAGVQSEFFERDYLRYETKDNYVHWRKARDQWYLDASLKGRLENRRDVDELPSLGAYRGRTRIGYAFDNPIYYAGRLDAGWLRRRDGDARYYTPFEDGLGDRDVLRVDTEHQVEAPFSLGVLAARGTPYVALRSTFWNEGADRDASPARTALIAGFDATTTLWKRYSGGSVHTLSPTVGLRADLAMQESGGDPVVIDRTEDPLEGRFVELGLRSRWWVPDTRERMDVSVRTAHGSDLPSGVKDGLQPIHVLADYLTYYKEVPIGATHDARYDTRTGNTTYSLSSLGFEPWQNVGIELGYQRGVSTVDQERLFESASVATRWRWTPKWEMEFGQSYAIAEGTGVGSEFTLRRLGHDFVTEVEVSHRSGEGSTFSLNFQPRIAWRRSGLGLLDRWLGVYH